jgi:tetratricopeptide (TPR) repeat protein
VKNFDLGAHSRAISTSSAEAQVWFDKGLNWVFGFNHEAGVACFEKALEFDPQCAMAWWGIAYGSGPFYNRPWRHFGADEAEKYTKLCFDASRKAAELSANATAIEQGIIATMVARHPKDHRVSDDEFDAWDLAYANALRELNDAHPDDLDVVALLAEALITRTPWQLWNVKTNEPADGADTLEAIALCERAIARCDERGISQHPGVLHVHIHALEMSGMPERAMRSADILGTLCPDAGHMNHMPGHIYVLCGKYLEAKEASEKAILADRKYLEYAGPYNFYTTARCHDLHLMMYTCMFLGQFQPAMQAAEEMCGTLTREVLSVQDRPQLAVTMEGYYSMKMHVLVRFGRWQDIVDAPMPEDPDLYCVSTAMHYYAKGVANAALGNIEDAERCQRLFEESVARIPAERMFFNNLAENILAVAREMLAGELAYHKGEHEQGYEHLRRAVQLDDNLEYSEPWVWMHPPRHALAALLLEQGHYDEAEKSYREDLGIDPHLQRCSQHADNVWALHGYVECLKQRDARDELPVYESKLAAALANTDISITSSCCCRKQVVAV